MTHGDGSTTTVSDVVLNADQVDSRYLGDATVSQAAADLPNLKGYGDVTDLAVAMTGDSALLTLISDFDSLPAGTAFADLRLDAEAILLRWTGADGLAATPVGNGAFDAQRLAALETYSGQELAPRDTVGDIADGNGEELAESWDRLLDELTAKLAVQGPLESTLSTPAFDVATDSFQAADATTLTSVYSAALTQLSADAGVAAGEWADHWGPILAVLTETLQRPNGLDVKADYAVQHLVAAMAASTQPLALDVLAQGLGLEGVNVGTSGDDTITRPDVNGLQVHVGGGGNDTLNGGVGQDVYVYGENFGQDVITDFDGILPTGDRIRFSTLNQDDVTIVRVGDDLVITVNGSTDSITVVDHFRLTEVNLAGLPLTGNRMIEEIQFADGSIMETVDIAVAVGLGTSASETLEGSGSQDILEGLGGDDILRGGDDGDAYFYSRGDGADTIEEVTTTTLLAASDILYLLKISSEHVTLFRDGQSDDVTLNFNWGGGDSVTLVDQFEYGPTGIGTKLELESRIETIFFDQGPSWSWETLQSETISAYTTTGDDITYGFGTADEFFASSGNDRLVGLDGGDTYHFGIGAGQDVIHDESLYFDAFFSPWLQYSWASNDVVVFDEGITAADVDFARNDAAPDLLITVAGSTDTLTVEGQFESLKLDLFNLLGVAWFDRIEEFQFADGTTLSWEDVLADVTTGDAGDNSLYGAWYEDTLDGKEGTDYLSGGNESDTYIFGRGYGQETIEDNQDNVLSNSIDRLKFNSDVAVGDVTFTRDGSTLDLLVSIDGTSDQVRLVNQYDVFETGVFGGQAWDRIDLFEWADGTVKTWAEISQDVIDGAATAGDDTILGSHENDVLNGGAGNDILSGWNGSDTYVFDRGYGHDVIEDNADTLLAPDDDKIQFAAGIDPTDITVSHGNDSDIIFTINDTGETLTIRNAFEFSAINWRSDEIESVEFDDGTVWYEADIMSRAIEAQQTSGDDIVTGFHLDDTIEGGTGNDVLAGEDGSDVYRFAPGFGSDEIHEDNVIGLENGEDTVQFLTGLSPSDIVLSRSQDGYDLILTFSGGEELRIVDQFYVKNILGARNDIEHFTFEDGTVWSDKEIRARLIDESVTSGNDTIIGFDGADRIDGGAGDDLLQGASGGDIYEFGVGSGHDTIEEVADFTSIVNGPDTVAFKPGIERANISFSQVGNDLIATHVNGVDSITIKDHFASFPHTAKIELFTFEDGTYLTAEMAETNAPGYNSAVDQTITGTDGDDVLDGGSGHDTLIGGDGNDIYVFGVGYGSETIDEQGTSSSSSFDKVAFNSDIAIEDIVLSISGDDLIISVSGTNDSLTIEGQFDAPALSARPQAVEEFVFSDGTVWTDEDVRSNLLSVQQTAGDDTVFGFFSDDRLSGGAGDDLLKGSDGSDTYEFEMGFGQDTIEEIPTNTSIDDNDAIFFGAGINPEDVTLSRTPGTDDLLVTVGLDTITVIDNFDPFSFQDSHTDIERIVFASGEEWSQEFIKFSVLDTARTSGDDVIIGFYTDDILDGGAGNDILVGRDGADTYLFGFGSGHDIVEDDLVYHPFLNSNEDAVQFGIGIEPDDVDFTRSGDDLIVSLTSGADTLTIRDQFEPSGSIYSQIERFQFANGDVISGDDAKDIAIQSQISDGDDVVYGSVRGDLLDARAGNDFISGGSGSDIYVFGRGSGSDTIDENGDVPVQAVDEIHFGEDVLPGDIEFARSGDDIILSIAGTGDQLTIRDQSPGIAIVAASLRDQVERVVFSNGDVWSAAELEERVISFQSTAGDDTVTGAYRADVLDGLAGNDALSGGEGNDTYIFGRGYDYDTINDNGGDLLDRVQFKSGIASADVTFSRDINDLIATIDGTNDTLVIVDHFDPSSLSDRIEEFLFSDEPNTVVTHEDIFTQLTTGTPGDDVLLGNNDDNTFDGGAGNDVLDTGNGDDVLTGGAGNDELRGGKHNDTYLYNLGDGNDVIRDDAHIASGGDRLVFGAGIIASDTTLSRDAGDDTDVIITLSDGSTIYLDIQVTSQDHGIEEIEFADGTIWDKAYIEQTSAITTNVISGTEGDDTLYGTSDADTFIGDGGDDTLYGYGGSDVFRYASGDGNDFIDEGSYAGDVDRLIFDDINQADVSFERLPNSTNDLQITITATGDTITFDDQFRSSVYGIEVIEFADGSELTESEIIPLTRYVGTAAGEYISGSAGDDVIIGYGGDDTLFGGYGGSDVYHYALGDGNDLINEDSYSGTVDRLIFDDINQADVSFGRPSSSTNDLQITITATGDTITFDDQFRSSLYGLEVIEFADGSELTESELVPLTPFVGTAAGEYISGSAGDDVFIGHGGDDTLFGGYGGSDVYHYALGDGNDLINEDSYSGTVDRLVFDDINQSDVSFARRIDNTNDLTLTVNASGETIVVDDQFRSAVYGLEEIEFADGTIWDAATIEANTPYTGDEQANTLYGTSSSETLIGNGGDDTLNGNAGDDTLIGGTGNDTFVFDNQFGFDVIGDFEAGVGVGDVVDVSAFGINDFSALTPLLSEFEGNTHITFADGSELTLESVTNAQLADDDFVFA